MKLFLALCALLFATPVGAKTIVFQATMYEVTLDKVVYYYKDGSDAGVYNFLKIHSSGNSCERNFTWDKSGSTPWSTLDSGPN